MKYVITRKILGRKNTVDINRDDFINAKTAKENLSIALGMEDKINIVLENYAEYEEELLRITMRRMLFSRYEHSSFIDDIHLVNRRLMNLLASCRLYIDHLKHDMSSIYGNSSPQLTSINKKLSKEYDAYLGYRVLDALRNYTQHRGLPISEISHWSFCLTDALERQRMRNTVTPMIDITALKEDGGFKKSVLAELVSLGNHIDIKPFVREYVTCIGSIHILVRNTITTDLDQWDNSILSMIQAYEATSDQSLCGLAAVEKDNNEKHVDVVYLSKNVIDRRKALILKNQQLSHFSYSYVSGEVVTEQD